MEEMEMDNEAMSNAYIATLNVGHPTTDDERLLLKQAGYVHVTGLGFLNPQNQERGIITSDPKYFGRYASNANRHWIFTLGGEVWLLRSQGATSTDARQLARNKFAPNGTGGIDLFARGEMFNEEDITERRENPDSIPFHFRERFQYILLTFLARKGRWF